MFALTVKNGHTRIYLTEGTQNGGGIARPAGVELLAHWTTPTSRRRRCSPRRRAGATPPDPATHTFPATYNGWQMPDVEDDGQPVLRHGRLLHRAVLVRPGRLHAGRDARHGLRDRLVRSTASSRATRRASAAGTAARTAARCSTRTPPAIPDGSATGADLRTFTDLTYDAQDQPPRRGAPTRRTSTTGCVERAERDPSRPARDRGQSGQPDPDLRGLGRRGDPHERRRSPTSRRSATRRSATAAARCRRRRAATPPASGCCRGCRRSSTTSTRS